MSVLVWLSGLRCRLEFRFRVRVEVGVYTHPTLTLTSSRGLMCGPGSFPCELEYKPCRISIDVWNTFWSRDRHYMCFRVKVEVKAKVKVRFVQFDGTLG